MGLRHVLLTIKCLLIVPNPESALNEEAGKLLLERYDDYCARAKLYTEIHAKPSESSTSTKSISNSTVAGANTQTNSETSSNENSEHSANKKTCNGVNGHENSTVKKPISKKDKLIKDKKKTLKRL